MSPEAQRDRGARAATLLQDELLVEAFTKVRDGLRAKWEATADDAQVEREHYWHQLRALDSVEKTIKGVVQSGKLAAADIERRAGAVARA